MEFKSADNPITDAGKTKQILSNLFYGWGYNFYRQENQLRADDLLLRNHISDLLGQCRAHITKQECEYRRIYLPSPTRDKPFPDASAVSAVRLFRKVLSDFEATETRIRTASVPEMDRVNQRHRSETGLLKALLAADENLVMAALELHTGITGVSDLQTCAVQSGDLLKQSQIHRLWESRQQVISVLIA